MVFWEMFGRGNDQSRNCTNFPIGEMYHWGTVWSGKYPVKEMSSRGNVRRGNFDRKTVCQKNGQSGNCQLGNCPGIMLCKSGVILITFLLFPIDFHRFLLSQ